MIGLDDAGGSPEMEEVKRAFVMTNERVLVVEPIDSVNSQEETKEGSSQ
ncbi:unnamed protein product, partial [Heterosigma akashiwo]